MRFEAYHVAPDSPQMEKDVLYAAASLLNRSHAPMAADLLRIAKLNAILPVEVEGFQEFTDRGMGGLIQFPHEQRPRAVLLGTNGFMEESGLDIPDLLEVTRRQWGKEKDALVWLLGWDGWVRAVFKFGKVGSKLAAKNVSKTSPVS